ncbi:MAG: AMP-binding protein [Actinomycetota bacterium]
MVVVAEPVGDDEHGRRRPLQDEGQLEARRPGADDLIEIMFTSGTTGEPKGVLHSHNTVRSGCRVIDEVYGLGPGDPCFMASTLAHQTGYGYGLLKPLSLGATVVYQDQWEPEQALDAIEAEGVVWTVSATAFAMDLVAAQRRRARDLDRFRFFICGGAPIPPKVVEDAAEVLGAELIAVWGMTENMIVTTTRPGDPVDLVSDSDGTPVEHMEIRVVDDEGRAVEVGQAGNLQCRGPSQALGYFHRQDLYAAAAPDGDWFDTGDVARLRGDGGIRIVGRTKDLVIRGGENVPVAEVEDLLLRHPAVAEVAVVAVPDDRLGERACAVITPPEGQPAPELHQLTAFLEEAGMARQFWPERLTVMAEMPHTPSGKIQKFKLRALIEADEAP